jgi:hypothetical protein|tara:strand:+ start:4381 stop:5028 length:648 start_codon:yes stop_codon:yes gene_type:complete
MPTNYSTTKKAVVNGVPAVPSNVDKNLKQYLNNLNELIESKLGVRGNALDRHVTLRELQNAGVVDRVDASGKFSPNAVNAQNRGFTNTGTMRMFTSQREKSFRSSTHTFAHGLGRVPDLVQLRAICTATGDEDYVVGDIVVLPNSVVETEGDKEGVSVMLTTTEIKLFFAEDGIAIVVERDGTGGQTVLNDVTSANSRWDIEVKAFLFQESTQGN